MENYHILERIGEGSFGKVYRGRRKFSGHIVALKFVTKQGKSARDLENLRQEITILRRLNHCNIIAMLDSFETEGEFCMVTEYAQGELFQVLEDEHSLPEEEIRKIAIQLLQALHVLHSNRIIHRDMKPQNILIGSKQQIKLADFGFARAIAHDASVLTSIKGTPLYMAPELVQEKPYNYTADLWSLGVILYELAVGRPPFYTDRIVSLIQMIVREPVNYPPTMSAGFQSFLAGLLNKDPSQRLTWPAILQHPFVLETAEQMEARLQLERQVRALPRFFDENQSTDGTRAGPESEVKPSVERLRSCDEWKICDPETGKQLDATEALAISRGDQRGRSAASRTANGKREAPANPFSAGLRSSKSAEEFQNVWTQMQRELDLEHVTAALLETPLFGRAARLLPDIPLQALSNEVVGAIHSLLHLQHRSQVSMLKHMDKLSSPEGLKQTRESMHRFLDVLVKSYTASAVSDDRVSDIMYQVVRCCMTSTSIVNAIDADGALATQLNYLELCKSDVQSILGVLSCKADPVVAVQSKTLKWLGCMIDRSRDLTTLLEVVLPSGLVETLCQILYSSENSRSPGGRISQRGRDRGIYSLLALAGFVQPDGSNWGPLHPFPVLTLVRDDLLPIPNSSLRVVKHLYKLRVKVHAEVGSQLLRNGLSELVAILRDEISERVRRKVEAGDDTDAEGEDSDDEDADQSATCCILKLLLHTCRASAPLSKKLAATTVVLERRRNGDIFAVLLRGFTSGALYSIERYFAAEFLAVVLRRGVLPTRQVWRIARALFPLLQSSRDVALLSALSTFFADVIESGNVDESALTDEDLHNGLSPVDEELWQLVAHGVLTSHCANAVFRLFSGGENRDSSATNESELPMDDKVQMLTSYNIRAQGLMDAGIVLFSRVAAKAAKQSPEGSDEDGDNGDSRRSRATKSFLAIFEQESVWQTLDDMMAASGADLLSPWGLFCFLKLMRMIREMQCSESRVETAINNHLLAHLVQLLELRHIEHLFHWPEAVGGGSNAVKALVHATVKVLGIPFMHSTPEELLVDTQEILYDAQCVEKLLGVLRFVFSTKEVHLGTSVLELPISFLSRLVTSSAHFGAQFVAADGMGVIKACGMLSSSCSPSLIIDTLLIVSQLARSSQENYNCILQAGLLPEFCDLLAHPEAMVRAKTLNCIGNLCRHSALFYHHFLESGSSERGINPSATILDGVIRGLTDPDSYVRRFACFAVGNAAFHNGELYDALRPAVPLLVRNLHSPEEKTRSNAGGALGNLVRNSDSLCDELCVQQAPWELFELAMTDTSTASRRIVLFSLGNLCVYPQCFYSLLEAEPGFVGELERLYEDVEADESSQRNIRRIMAKVEALSGDGSRHADTS